MEKTATSLQYWGGVVRPWFSITGVPWVRELSFRGHACRLARGSDNVGNGICLLPESVVSFPTSHSLREERHFMGPIGESAEGTNRLFTILHMPTQCGMIFSFCDPRTHFSRSSFA